MAALDTAPPRRLRRRRGPQKTVSAVAAALLNAIYQGRGAERFHRASPGDPAKRLVRQIAKRGVRCGLTPAAARRGSV
jgi:hypothetical protein